MLGFSNREFIVMCGTISNANSVPLGTVRPVYRTGVSLSPVKAFYIFNQQIYFII